jgi:uncharacterized protein (DUF697 family)
MFPCVIPLVRKLQSKLKRPSLPKTSAMETTDAGSIEVEVVGPELCRDRARSWVHAYAAGGAVFAFVPIPVPGSTTAGLVALETTMIHAISRIYGQHLDMKDAAAMVTGLQVAGGALKTVAREAVGFIPGIGWVIRGAIAAAAIEAIGNTVIGMFERRFPHRACAIPAS